MKPLLSFGHNRFRCILADPPWNHQNWSQEGDGRSAVQHYSIMSLGDIMDLPVREISDTECWLFLWCISSMIPQAYDVMDAWGFNNSGMAFTWAKLNKSGEGFFMGLGHTTRKNAELCLLGRRGKPPRNSAKVRELIVSPVREHSRKPNEQYERIEEFCDGPRIEIFARSRRKGWSAWGNQADLFIP